MSLSRRVARPLLSAIFVFGGLDAVRHPEGKVAAAQKVTGPLAEKVPGLPKDPATLVRLNGAVQIGAGALLALGRFRRLAALALIASIIPTTAAGHRFWQEDDEGVKQQQQVHFLKNLGLLGGLILAAVDTEGSPSLGWRARRRAHQAVNVLDRLS
jgi:putative oxidoreductase